MGWASAQPLHKLSNLILVLQVWYYYLHFTETQTVAQRGHVPHAMSHRWQSSDANAEIQSGERTEQCLGQELRLLPIASHKLRALDI